MDVTALLGPLQRAQLALGRLDGAASILPDPHLFLYMYVHKEALLSSQIEGTHSSLSDLLVFETEEAPGFPIEDVAEVSCYVAALNNGLEWLRDGLPLSLRLIAQTFGGVNTALAGAAITVRATYEVPFLAQATMEPMHCTVHMHTESARSGSVPRSSRAHKRRQRRPPA